MFLKLVVMFLFVSQLLATPQLPEFPQYDAEVLTGPLQSLEPVIGPIIDPIIEQIVEPIVEPKCAVQSTFAKNIIKNPMFGNGVSQPCGTDYVHICNDGILGIYPPCTYEPVPPPIYGFTCTGSCCPGFCVSKKQYPLEQTECAKFNDFPLGGLPMRLYQGRYECLNGISNKVCVQKSFDRSIGEIRYFGCTKPSDCPNFCCNPVVSRGKCYYPV